MLVWLSLLHPKMVMRIKAQRIHFKCRLGQSQKQEPKILKETFNELVKELSWANPTFK